MPSIKDVDKLIINTVENETVYKYMEDNNLLQEDELYLVAGDSLPPITEEDNGKVLGVTNGEWQVVDQTSPLTPGTDYLTPTQISNSYVAKVNGKGLSTNDLTNELKAQYDKAEQNVQSNWNETNTSSDAYILNKPYIPTKMSDLEQDVETGKIDAIKVNNVAQTITDKTVNISVPTALSGLTDDATHRLVTDAEKTAWNNKVDASDIPQNALVLNASLDLNTSNISNSSITYNPTAAGNMALLDLYNYLVTGDGKGQPVFLKVKYSTIIEDVVVDAYAYFKLLNFTGSDYRPSYKEFVFGGQVNGQIGYDASKYNLVITAYYDGDHSVSNGWKIDHYKISYYNNLSSTPTIPSKTSQLTNNSGYITINNIPEWSRQDVKPEYTSDEIIYSKGVTNVIPVLGSRTTDFSVKAFSDTGTFQTRVTVGDTLTPELDITSSSDYEYYRMDSEAIYTMASGKEVLVYNFDFGNNGPGYDGYHSSNLYTVLNNASKNLLDDLINGNYYIKYNNAIWKAIGAGQYNANYDRSDTVRLKEITSVTIEVVEPPMTEKEKIDSIAISDEYVYAADLIDSSSIENPIDAGTLQGYSASDFQLKSQMPAVPTKVSQLSNDRGYVTNTELPTVPRFTSQLINDSGFIDNAPTKLSELSNDSGFITSGDLPDSSLCITVTNNSGQFSADKTFAEIKAAYDAHQYIYVITSNMGPYVYTPYMVTDSLILFTYMIAGSTTVTTFTMSVTSVDAWGYNVTSSNTIPAKTSDLANDSGFITSSSLSSYAPLASPTFTGAAKVSANANYTTAQLRNVIISTADPSGGSNGDIWIKYEA